MACPGPAGFTHADYLDTQGACQLQRRKKWLEFLQFRRFRPEGTYVPSSSRDTFAPQKSLPASFEYESGGARYHDDRGITGGERNAG